MNLSGIKHWMVLNKALKQYNKKSSNPITLSELVVLYAIAYKGRLVGCTLERVYWLLKGLSRTRNRNKLRDIFRKFAEQGLITKISSNPSKYIVSYLGKNLLNAVERSIKLQRIDKIQLTPNSQPDSNEQNKKNLSC